MAAVSGRGLVHVSSSPTQLGDTQPQNHIQKTKLTLEPPPLLTSPCAPRALLLNTVRKPWSFVIWACSTLLVWKDHSVIGRSPTHELRDRRQTHTRVRCEIGVLHRSGFLLSVEAGSLAGRRPQCSLWGGRRERCAPSTPRPGCTRGIQGSSTQHFLEHEHEHRNPPACSMHPQLSPYTDAGKCTDLIDEFKKCHLEVSRLPACVCAHPVVCSVSPAPDETISLLFPSFLKNPGGKFLGACNEAKTLMDKCLKSVV